MKNLLFIFSLFVCLSVSGQLLTTQGKFIVNDQNEEVILRGMGPGGWLLMEGYMMQTSEVAGSQHEIKEKLIELMGTEKTETFFAKWRENHFTKRDVDSLAAWGFNSIRIPMHYNLFTLPIEQEPVGGEHTWIETGFSLIDSVLKWSKPHEIYVILDLHAAPGGQGTGSEINDYDPDKPSLWESNLNKEKTVALWERIAERYKDEPWIGGYDILNEPHWDIPNGTALKNLYVNITNAIRSVDQNHIIYIEGNWYANDYTGLTPPWDDNMVYSFHKYWNYTNDNDLDWVLPMRNNYNVPLWMGESGENSNTWFTDAIHLFESNGIGWAWWTIRKIGDIDSPYAVEINPGYQKIIDYWKGEGSKPSEEEAFDAMMTLVDNLLVENSQYRKDVPDALIRQPHTDETIPYTEHTIPGIIHASDFDLGKNGFAYLDSKVADYHLSEGSFQAWNDGWAYRNDGVDIQTNKDNVNSNGFHVGFTDAGEWMKYTVEVEETGHYIAKVRLASDVNTGKFHLSIDEQNVTSVQETPNTGGWDVFFTYTIQDTFLIDNTQNELKLHFDQASMNVSSLEFIKIEGEPSVAAKSITGEVHENERSILLTVNQNVDASTVVNSEEHFQVIVNGLAESIDSVNLSDQRTIQVFLSEPVLYSDKITISYSGSSIMSEAGTSLLPFSKQFVINNIEERYLLPGKVESENYFVQSGLETEETTDNGGGRNIGYTDRNDYADYKIFVRDSANYQIHIRVAAESQTGRIGFYLVDENSNTEELVQIALPVTGGWQTWQTISDEITLPAGTHILRMKVLSSGFNMNWFSINRISNKVLSLAENVEEKINIYPNPAKTFIHIDSDKFHYCDLIDLNGRTVLKQKILEDRNIDIQNVQEGIYIISIYDKNSKNFWHC